MTETMSEGWGSAVNIPGPAHYIRQGRALCGRMMILGTPIWETNQKDGPEPRPRSQDTCRECWRRKTGWKKPAKQEIANRRPRANKPRS